MHAHLSMLHSIEHEINSGPAGAYAYFLCTHYAHIETSKPTGITFQSSTQREGPASLLKSENL